VDANPNRIKAYLDDEMPELQGNSGQVLVSYQ
jgi:hypothetical protein